MSRVIFHIDINAFFASAHTITDPSLEGKPVVISSLNRGSVITTASYEARKYGIGSAMPLSIAKRLCPDLVVIPMDFPLYRSLSQRFINIIRSYSPLLQQASIDECFVDVTDTIKHYEKPLDLAVEIQQTVFETLKLPISIGVAPNKFLAKMASDMVKPFGITILRKRDVQEKLWPLDISEMFGIGRKTVPKLYQAGFQTIGDIANAEYDALSPYLGNQTQSFIDKANGHGSTHIDTDEQRKSVGQSRTFKDPLSNIEEVTLIFSERLEEIVMKLQKEDVLVKTITISYRIEGQSTVNKSHTFEEFTNDYEVLMERAMLLFHQEDTDSGITFLGVSTSQLISRKDSQEQLHMQF